MTAYVLYLRVSTQRQGQSGLGLDAQLTACQAIVQSGRVLGQYVEVESGRQNDRPQLKLALAECRRTGATLVVAKLDRLSRNLAFLAAMLEGKVPFVCADNPHANETMLAMLAVFAQHEARAISERTKAALAAAKARGVRLGNPTGVGRAFSEAERAAGAATTRARADERAQEVLPLLSEMRGLSLAGMAEALNARGVRTARGGPWKPEQVRRVLARG